MLQLSDLDGLDQAKPEYFAAEGVVSLELINAFEQGSQGWGVRRDVSVYLALAVQLRAALKLANVADEAQRKLKGVQMELGRVRKALDGAKLAAAASEASARKQQERADGLVVELREAFNDFGLTDDE